MQSTIISILVFMSVVAATPVADNDTVEFEHQGIIYRVYDNQATVAHVNYTADHLSDSITIPAEVKHKNVTYSVKTVGREAFVSSNFRSITLPESIDSIEPFAFYTCLQLSHIKLPSGLKNISEGTFCVCRSLRTIKLPEGLRTIGIRAFARCSSLESLVVPDSVTYLGDDAFYECTSLKNLTIGQSVNHIGSQAFYRVINLETFILRAETPPAVRESLNAHVYGKTIYVPEVAVEAYRKNRIWRYLNIQPINQ